MCSLFSPLLYLPYIQPLIHAYKYNCIQSATSDCCTTDEGEDGNAAADDDNSDDGKTFRITIKEVFPQTKTQVHDKDRWSPTHKSVKSILLLLSYHRGIVDVVVTKKKRVFLLISTWSGKSMTHHHLPWETCTCTAAINNGRRIPIDHKGESLLCAYVGLQVCKPVHMCYYPLSSWASITTSSWIMQRYKIKEHPCACWRINGLINDVRGDAKPKGLL